MSVLKLLFFLLYISAYGSAKLVGINDAKEYKKVLKARTNVLFAFTNKKADLDKQNLASKLEAAAKQISGQATIGYVECESDRQLKQICKKHKPDSAVSLVHFSKGEYNKDYDRQVEIKSIVNFLKDPTGDPPWEEDPSAKNIAHLDDSNFDSTLAKKKKTLIMFYAPWCGHCKAMKPEFVAAADELTPNKKSPFIIAALDATKSPAAAQKYNVSGYPTVLYFENGKLLHQCNERKKDGIISWLNNPAAPPPPPPPEPQWSDEPSDVVHLTDDTFNKVIAENPSVLVMFYAPWCGHCKKAKPEYTQAATEMKAEGVTGVLAALDATLHPKAAAKFDVKGYPTLIYFKDGKKAFDYGSDRTREGFLNFMKDPKEPPPPPPPEAKWSETKSDVVHFTESTFHKWIKRNKNKHALVMFYAPWCGHCKHLKPFFVEAASELASTNAILGAIDATEERKLGDEFGVKGYPTLKYFHDGKLQGDYEGGRTKEALVQWLKDRLDGKPLPRSRSEL